MKCNWLNARKIAKVFVNLKKLTFDSETETLRRYKL